MKIFSNNPQHTFSRISLGKFYLCFIFQFIVIGYIKLFSQTHEICSFISQEIPLISTCEFVESTNGNSYFYLSLNATLAESLISEGKSHFFSEQIVSALITVMFNSIRNNHGADAVFMETLNGAGCLELTRTSFLSCIGYSDDNEKFVSCITNSITTRVCPKDLLDKYWFEARRLEKKGNLIEAAQLFQKFAEAELASQSTRKEKYFEALNSAGWLFHLSGQNEKAISNFKKVITNSNTPGLQLKVGFAYNGIGAIYLKSAQYEAALEYIQKSLELYKRINNKPGICSALINKGVLHVKMGDLNENTIEDYLNCLSVYRENKMIREEGRVLMNISSYYYERREYSEGLKYMKEALPIIREYGDKHEISNLLSNIGVTYFKKRDWKIAEEYLKEALTISIQSGIMEDKGLFLNNIGGYFEERQEYTKAINYYEQALEIFRDINQPANIIMSLENSARLHREIGMLTKANEYFKESLEIAERIGNIGNIASASYQLGLSNFLEGKYYEAINSLEEAAKLGESLEDQSLTIRSLNQLGMVYIELGEFDKAFDYLDKVLLLDQETGGKNSSGILNNIGMAYFELGSHRIAEEHYNKALSFAKGNHELIPIYSNLASLHNSLDQFEQAINYYKKALDLAISLNQKMRMASILNNIGTIYIGTGDLERAIQFLNSSLEIAQELNQTSWVALSSANIGSVYLNSHKYRSAERILNKALKMAEKQGHSKYTSLILSMLGKVHYDIGNYDKAIYYLKESIEYLDKIRLTASGELRRDFTDAQMTPYEYLFSSYVRQNKLDSAYLAIESSKARFFKEELSETGHLISIPALKTLQKSISNNTVITYYANSNRENKIILALTKDTIIGFEVSDKELLKSYFKNKSITKDEKQYNKNEYFDELGLLGLKNRPINSNFDVFIIDYINSLKKNSSIGEVQSKKIGRELFDLLIHQIEPILINKSDLIIIPDGVLSFLPFETLIDKKGKYLIESYNISYVQSSAIHQMINNRIFDQNRKSIIAFGGAVYDSVTYEVDMQYDMQQKNSLFKNGLLKIKENKSLRNIYTSLGVKYWSNLPGTLKEVNDIKRLVSGSEIVTGKNVSEKNINDLSIKGRLADFKVIHFATHGIMIPEFPGLSAIVVSQINRIENMEDGYLNAKELGNLKLKADLVNLSACETGLGRIYDGEGVVGLIQPLILSGANSVSLSLWPVSDESSPQFMTQMYELVCTKGYTLDLAMNETKRKFINGDFGDKYKSPFYWAPYIYNGKKYNKIEIEKKGSIQPMIFFLITSLILVIFFSVIWAKKKNAIS